MSVDEISRDVDHYLRQVEAGETVVVTRAGRAVAEIKPMTEPSAPAPGALRPYGLCQGQFTVPDDFDAPLPADVIGAFEGAEGT